MFQTKGRIGPSWLAKVQDSQPEDGVGAVVATIQAAFVCADSLYDDQAMPNQW